MTDTAYDTSGTRMATCTSTGAIHVFDREGGEDGSPGVWRQSAGWLAHDGGASATSITFAGAEFGRCVASAASDGTVCVWREVLRAPGADAAAAALAAAEDGAAPWERCGFLRANASAVTAIAFAPAAFGLQLACGGDDGVVRFYSPADTLALAGWELCNEHEALTPGARVTALAWCRPAGADGGGGDRTGGAPMLAVALSWPGSGTNDARVLTYDDANMRWRITSTLYAGGATVSALAWAPRTNVADAAETIAAALGRDAGVFRVHGGDGAGGGGDASARAAPPGGGVGEGGDRRSELAASLSHPAAVASMDWNAVGNTLATSAMDGVVRMWAANAQTGAWEARAQLVGE